MRASVIKAQSYHDAGGAYGGRRLASRAVFYTRDWRYLHHYLDLSAIYHRDRLAAVIRAVRPGRRSSGARDGYGEWTDLQRSPFFRLWAHAAIEEILSALYERLETPPP